MKTTLIKVVGGNVVSQLLGVISVPLMLTSYPTVDIGAYGFFISASAIASVFVSFRAENIMFSVSNDAARSLYNFCIAWLFFAALVVIGVTSAYTVSTASHLTLATIAASFSIAMFNTGYGISVRQGETNHYVFAKVLRNLIELMAVVICISFSLRITYLAWLVAGSYMVAALYSSYRSLSIRFSDITAGFKVLRDNIEFLRSDFLASALNVAALNLPVMFFYVRGDERLSGIFFSITRILGTPTLMLAQSIGTSLKQHASDELATSGTCENSLRFVINKIILRPFPLYAAVWLLVVMGSFVFIMPKNRDVFWVVVCLSALFFVRYIFNCINSIIYVLRLQRENIVFQASLLFGGIGGLFVPSDNITGVACYSFLSGIVYIAFFIWLLRSIYSPINSAGVAKQ